ncbi:MAG: thiamine-phosphate kinase [Candidatus Acidiferrales bacterium]|jgi:thiamine-monophosphate kinase
MIGEDELIKRIARAIPSEIGQRRIVSRSGVRLGIGDDAAVLALASGSDWVLSCDAFLEGVHFLAKHHPPDSVGFKSLVRATSDLAAMGATPRFFVLTLALPVDRTGAWLDAFLRGMGRTARQLKMRLLGGDMSRFPFVSINITVLGEIAPGLAVTRAGAQPGDILYVTGRLGRAQLGLELVKNWSFSELKGRLTRQNGLFRQHLYPQIRVQLGAWLAQHRVASAMMDISDGLSTDLSRLCVASGVGARLWAERIPRIEIPAQFRKLRLDPLQMALNGGDDYELLFTVPRGRAKLLRKAPQFSDMTAIGEIERGKRILLVGTDGRAKPLKPGGWDSFRGKSSRDAR